MHHETEEVIADIPRTTKKESIVPIPEEYCQGILTINEFKEEFGLLSADSSQQAKTIDEKLYRMSLKEQIVGWNVF